MDQMKLALLKALGQKTLDQATAQAAKADPGNCEVCGDKLTEDHDGTKCRKLVEETKRKLQ